MRTEQELLSGIALTTFKLHGQILEVAEELARPAGLTAARWQVLGAVLREPLTVAGIAREMGLTRQSLQRLADVLVEQGMLERLPNPAHRRSPLYRATSDGLEAVRRIDPQHARFARRLVESFGADDLGAALDSLQKLVKTLDSLSE